MDDVTTPRRDREFLIFCLLFFFSNLYMCVWQTFFPIYYKSLHMTAFEIGVLTAIGPVVNLFMPPLFGQAADRSRYKNTMVSFGIIMCALIATLYLLGSNFYYIAMVTALFFTFNGSIEPISSSIALERAAIKGYSYGHMRMAGLAGYCVMSLLVGYVADLDINYIFLLLIAGLLCEFVVSRLTPKVKGHQREGRKISFVVVWKDKRFLIFQAFALVVFTTLGMYFTFFALYLTDGLGASKTIVGIAQISGTVFEFVFFFLSPRLLRRFKMQHLLLFFMAVISLRWLLTGLVHDPIALIFVNLLHFPCSGTGYMMNNYVNKNVLPELRASGQTLNSVVNGGLARIFGSLIGGFFVGRVGYANTFLFMSGLCAAAFIAFFFIFSVMIKRDGEKAAQVV